MSGRVGRVEVPAVAAVAYTGSAIGSDVAASLWGSVSGSGLTAAPFGLDWTLGGLVPAARARHLSRGRARLTSVPGFVGGVSQR